MKKYITHRSFSSILSCSFLPRQEASREGHFPARLRFRHPHQQLQMPQGPRRGSLSHPQPRRSSLPLVPGRPSQVRLRLQRLRLREEGLRRLRRLRRRIRRGRPRGHRHRQRHRAGDHQPEPQPGQRRNHGWYRDRRNRNGVQEEQEQR